jgi:hypothetical protein
VKGGVGLDPAEGRWFSLALRRDHIKVFRQVSGLGFRVSSFSSLGFRVWAFSPILARSVLIGRKSSDSQRRNRSSECKIRSPRPAHIFSADPSPRRLGLARPKRYCWVHRRDRETHWSVHARALSTLFACLGNLSTSREASGCALFVEDSTMLS